MAHETITKSKRFYCVSLTPDICKTPIGNSTPPIPYTVIGEFKEAKNVSSNVKTHGEPVILHGKSFIPTVKGDAAGSAGGIKSGTVGKRVETKEFSSSKGSNDTKTVQEALLVWINDRNTIARIYQRGVKAARSRLKKYADDAREKLKESAQDYKDNISPGLHEFGGDAMNAGGKVVMGSAVVGGAGLVVGATVIGAPVAVGMEAAAAAGATVGTVVTGVGVAAESGATGLDQAADYILDGKTPPVMDKLLGLGGTLLEKVALKKIPGASDLINWVSKKVFPGQKPKPAKKTKIDPAANAHKDSDAKPGGKVEKPKEEKAGKPSDCCPKNAAPAGKAAKSNHPVHFGTGEEILSQTDFVVDGTIPIVWSRTYRSGSETEDWGLLGARWATPFTTSLSLCPQGLVYHDGSGRSLRLPSIAIGQVQDSRAEGFSLTRDSESQFSLVWRDGSSDIFQRGPDAYLPHGYQGVNAILKPRAPLLTERYYLSRSAGRDGKGVNIDRHHTAQAGEVLLRVRTDDGLVIEALREESRPANSAGQDLATGKPPFARIGRIEEIRADGTRVCHVSYRYEAEPKTAPDPQGLDTPTPAQGTFAALPQRFNLVAQTNMIGQSCTYAYIHHMLVQYTTYSGFAHGLEWVSLAALRERWADSPLDDAQLTERYPITLENSYQARAISTTTADGNDQIRIVYIDNDTTRVTEANGGVLEYTFNSNWLCTDVRRVAPDGGPGKSLGRREWDKDGMLLADIDDQGNATRYSYDGTGNLATITDARRHITRIEYDAHNQPITVTDALGHTSRRIFDDAGRIVESTDALGRSTRYTYDTQGRLVILTDARGGTKQLSYDTAGRLVATTDCSNFTNRYAYDADNRLAAVTDAIGNTSHYQYDALGRLVVVTQPDQSSETFSYDSEGNLVAHTDAKGQVTRYRYNGHNLPIERIDTKGQTLEYRYDKALRLIELINGNGETYRFTYDAESRLASEIGFDGKTTTYTYDGAGQLIASDCNGAHTDFMRDALGLLLAKATADGNVRYAYDALGRLTAVAVAQAEQHFTYDPVGQLIDERTAYRLTSSGLPGISGKPQATATSASFTLTHAYDELGNRIKTTLPNGRTIDTLRYGSGHWHGSLWQGTPLVDLERDHLHRETTRQSGSGTARLSSTRAYDPQSRLSAITINRGLERLRERRYIYDDTGNLTNINDTQRGSNTYAYDPLGQLLSAVQPNLTETFAFDPAGNLLEANNTNDAARNIAANDSSAAHLLDLNALAEQPSPGNKAPRLAKVTHNLLQQYMGYAYEYDVQGNTVVKHLRTVPSANEASTLALAYDVENRLVTATRNWDNARQVAHYNYDAFGRRIAKQVTEDRWNNSQDKNTAPPESSTTRTTLFLWDGDVLAQEIHPGKTVTYLYEPDGFVPLARIESNDALHSYAPATTHIPRQSQWEMPQDKTDAAAHVSAWQLQQSIEQEQAHQDRWQLRQTQATEEAANDSIHYYQCDHLGTPLELTDEQGNIAWSAKYKAWGKILRVDIHKVEQPLRFQGQYEDAETGLYYNRHRYYDPDSARYVTQDPIGLAGGNNLYRYAPSPTHWVDPLGLTCKAYRVIRPDEDPSKGLSAKNPNAVYKPEGHVLHGSKSGFSSQYISVTKSLAVAEIWAKATGNRIVEIDMSKVDGEVIDVSGPCGPLKGKTAQNWAKKSQEMLILGRVPPEAMRVL